VIDAGSPDTSPAPTLFRCGGGVTVSACDQTTETCCATFDTNAFHFACQPQTASCLGVPISCARQADCPANSVCCVTDSSQSCVTRGTCTGDLVCDPNAPTSECQRGQLCVPFNNPTVPYFSCH
jgi:hypothetical protein